jgi:hypothetical protein
MRITWSLTIFAMIALPLWGADAVDFDKLFRAASGQLLPEPATEGKANQEELITPAPTPSPPKFGPLNSVDRGNGVPTNGTETGISSPTLQLPREANSPSDSLIMPITAPALPLNGSIHSSVLQGPLNDVPPSVGSMNSPEIGSSITTECHPNGSDQIDFNSVFQETQPQPQPPAQSQPQDLVHPIPIRTPQLPCGPAPCHAQICTVGCNPTTPAVGCLYDGPILGVPRGTMDDLYRCPNCYRDIWAGYAQEKAREEDRLQKKLRGKDCSTCKPQRIGCPTP